MLIAIFGSSNTVLLHFLVGFCLGAKPGVTLHLTLNLFGAIRRPNQTCIQKKVRIDCF
jgi:hypothetical protein